MANGTKVFVAIVDGNGVTRYVTADADVNGNLILYSVPAVGEQPVSASNPLPVTGAATTAGAPAASAVAVGGTPVVVFAAESVGPGGAFVVNPADAAEDLFVDPVAPPGLSAGGTTVRLAPGQPYSLPPQLTGPVWANAATSGHAFAAVRF